MGRIVFIKVDGEKYVAANSIIEIMEKSIAAKGNPTNIYLLTATNGETYTASKAAVEAVFNLVEKRIKKPIGAI